MNSTTRVLSELSRAQLVREDIAAAELEYVFKHALVQEAAYASLLKTARVELHLRIAEAIERAPTPNRETEAAMLVWHYDRAGREDKVLRYALAAGDAASQVRAYAEAIAHYDRALTAAGRIEPMGDAECNLARAAHVNRGALLEAQNRFAEAAANYADMIAFAARHGDVSAESEATNHLVTVRILREGPGADILEAAERALDLAERSGATLLIGRAVWNLGLYYRFIEPARAEAHLDRARSLALSQTPMTREARELAASALTDSTIASFASGHNRRAEAGARQAIEEYRSWAISTCSPMPMAAWPLPCTWAGARPKRAWRPRSASPSANASSAPGLRSSAGIRSCTSRSTRAASSPT